MGDLTSTDSKNFRVGLSDKTFIIDPTRHYEHPTLGQGAYYAMPTAHSSTALKMCSFSDP